MPTSIRGPLRRVPLVAALLLLSVPVEATENSAGAALDALEQLTERLVVEGRWDRAEAVLGPAIEIAEALGDVPAASRLAVRRAENLVDRASQRVERFEEAIATAEAALSRAEALGDPLLVGAAAEQLGRALYHRKLWTGVGEWEPVAALYERALAARTRAAHLPAIAESTFHVGLMAERLGRPEEGLAGFRRALELATTAGDNRIRAYALRHLAYSDPELSEEEALELHLEALALRERVGHGIGRLYGHVSVASAFLALGRDRDAAPHVESACADAEALDTPRGRIACRISRGRLALARNEPDRAKSECTAALNLATALAVARNVRAAERCLAEVASPS